MLAHKITFYVPGTVNVNVPAPDKQAEVTARVQDMLTEMFGGTSTQTVVGTYKAACGIVRESVNLVSAFMENLAQVGDVLAMAADVAHEMGQECVAVETDGKMQFVGATQAKAAA